MWDTILNINSILTIIASVYGIYAIGSGILAWDWKQIALGVFVAAFFLTAQIVIGAFAD